MSKVEVVIDEKIYYVSKPTAKDEAKAKLQQSRTFNDALDGGACLRSQLNKVLKNRKVWDDTDDAEVESISNKIQENLKRLEEGGFELMEARKLAITTNSLRLDLINKISVLNEHKSLTAEGQADDAYFDTLVSCCCFNEDGSKVFRSYDDYIARSKEDVAAKLAKKVSEVIYGDFDYVKDLPENKFLSEYGFINNNMEYINEEGELVNSEYKVFEKEQPVKVEKKPFLKNGQPIEK